MHKLKNIVVVKIAGMILFVLTLLFGDGIFRKRTD